MFKKFVFFSLVISISFILSACSFWSKKPAIEEPEKPTEDDNEIVVISDDKKFVDLKSSGSINKFSDYQEFSDFISSQSFSGHYYSDFMARSGEIAFDMLESSLGSASEVPTKTHSDDFSETNVQVAGVDEADIVKTDGKYIYFLVNKSLIIANAYPASDLEIIFQIDFESRPTDIYLHDEKMIVIGSDFSLNKGDYNRLYSNFTFVNVYDISEPSQTKKIKNLVFEGYYTNSRLIAGHLYLILNNNIRRDSDSSDLVPILIEDGKLLSSDCLVDSDCFTPEIYYFDSIYDSYNLTSINTIDLNNQVEVLNSQSYLLSSNQTIYVSLDNIYITFPYYLRNIDSLLVDLFTEFIFDKLGEKEKALVLEIYQISDEILNEQEKQAKLRQIYERFVTEDENIEKEFQLFVVENFKDLSDQIEKTFVHRFSLENIVPEHKAEGFVPGNILNQFSIDEDKEANLRIATTKNNNFFRFFYLDGIDPELLLSYSNVFVLSPDLDIIGSARNIAPDERIYSARFMGDRAYLVTFKEIDPFFVIDLKEPSNPQVLGELKIPGFSTYLHPYDENTIIGLGYDTSLSQWGGVITEGVKLALFDVSNPENPIELDNFIAGEAGSQSFALYNHKAFLFSHHKNLLLLPVFLRNYEFEDQKSNFAGALVFSIDDKKFNLRGKINHSEEKTDDKVNHWCGHRCYNNSVQRGLYIDDVIYTFSNNYLKANDLNSLELVNEIELFKYIEDDQIVIPMPRPIPERSIILPD